MNGRSVVVMALEIIIAFNVTMQDYNEVKHLVVPVCVESELEISLFVPVETGNHSVVWNRYI